MNEVDKRIEQLSPARQKLLERMNTTALKKVCYPLSYSQRGMWFIDQLEPGTALYNMPFGSRYTGTLDHAALWRAIREIVQRHESLRTIFPNRNGVAVQEVLQDIGPLERMEDLTHLPQPGREEELRRRIRAHTYQPFDLAKGPLFYAVLFKQADDDHVLYFNMHHIIGDGWSVYILQRELDALYRAYAQGAQASPLPALALQFGDYALWQRGWMSSPAMQQQLGFWKEQLAGVAEAVLPTDYPRPAILAHKGRSIGAILAPKLSVGLTEFCRREGATPFMALLAIFQLALARYLGCRDFLIGTPIANRDRLETEGIIGCFINTLVLRSDAKSGLNFRQLAGKVRDRTLAAYEHQNLPFAKLVEDLVPIQVLSRTPIFQAMFSFENYPSSKSLPDLEQSDMGIGMDMTKLEMTLTMGEQDGIYRWTFEYDADLYSPVRMQRMMAYFGGLLEAVVADPERDIWDDAVLPVAERRHLEAWGRGEAPCWSDELAATLFERAAARHGEAVAVCSEAGMTSYRELNEQADRLARRLRQLGVGPEVAVGALLERGTALYAAVLAILKVGGVYVPLDPAYPGERVAYMAADARLRVLVVEERTRALAPRGPWTSLDVDARCPEPAPEAARVPVLSPDNLAYVIYTSGSTGQPKGVGVTQRALANQLQWVTRAFELTPQDRFLQKTSISFDSSIEEILAPLVAGACIVAARPGGQYDAQYLADVVAREAVTCVDLSPSLMEALLQVVDVAAWHRVRLVICGGEALKPEQVRAFRARLPVTLLNAYGPTETAIQSAWSSELDGEEVVPIGRPVADTQLHVLDEHMAVAPIGTRGELYIGGVGVARGYLGRPALTAERFVPDPFGRAGTRLYRTGDQVRWREDGQLEFLGRTDHQVKLRGYRIELDEIDRVVESHPQVRQAQVVVREDHPGMQQLVAYVVADTAAATPPMDVNVLRQHVAKAVPAYMVPAAFVVLESMPVMPNGKVDRQGLPVPAQSAFSVRVYEAPVGDMEWRIAAIFQDVLKVEQVGRHDSFFELGGHSLLAVQLISRIQRAVNLEFRLMDLFTHPTVQQIVRALLDADQAKLPPVVPASNREKLPLSFAQKRLWFLDQIDGVDRAYNIPFGLRLKGRLDEAALRRALDHIVARHEVLRTRFQLVDDDPVQQIGPAGDGAFHLVEENLEFHASQAQALQQVIKGEVVTGFDLAAGPVIRGRLVRLAADDHVLLVVMHHVTSDGWSIGLFVDEFAALYRAFHSGRASPLLPLGLQYGDYAAWQRQWLSGDVLRLQIDYWKTRLADAPPRLLLPTDRPHPAQQDFAGASVGLEFDAELTRELRRLSQAHGVTMYMTLLAGWALLLRRLSGQHEVVIGTPTANRPMRELEDLIGFFINMLALRLDLSGALTVSQLLGRVRDTFLSAHQHEHLSFEQVVEVTRPARSAAYSPIFQVMFSWQNASQGQLALPELEVTGVEMASSGTAKYDLSLAMEDREHHMTGSVEFATSLFDRGTIERFAGYFRQLLREMTVDATRRIDDLTMLAPEERRQVLDDWNAAAISDLPADYAHQLIAEQAARTPERAALVHGERVVTYAELDARSNRLARHLRALGVRAEDRVGLCVERGPEMVLGLLAVLKAGGAYVPLDPAYPVARLRLMLDDSAPTVLLTQAHLRTLGEDSGLPTFDISDETVWSAYPATELEPAGLSPGSLAYVIYTSGSTGMPKGVMLQHANLTNFLGWGRQAFSADLLSHTLAATSLSFDLAVFECLLPLTCGGTVHIVANVLELAHASVPVTLVNTVPSALEALLDSGSLPATARVVNLAGEALRPGLVERVFATSNVQTVCNLYGPTETTTYSTWTQVERGEAFAGHVGRPIANTRIYLLDERGQPVPAGVIGELYIGGAGVARGYHRRGALTAERFVADPFAAQPDARMYRTGDLARWLAGGDIEYLGRADHQVKLRGYRIEPGEIERALESHPEVQQAIVLLREDQPGHRQLVAYIVAGREPSVSARAEDLRDYLGQRLPGYMVPAAFVALDSLPLTPNGKLDRKALHAPAQSAFSLRVYEAPEGDTERRIAGIFQDVLEVEQVGRHDSFFELGGHSLLAVKLMRRIEHALAIFLPLRRLFETPTVALIAASVEPSLSTDAAARDDLPVGVIELRKGTCTPPLFLVHPIGGTVFCYMELANALGPEASVYALETVVDESNELPSLASLAQDYLRRIRAVQPTGPYRLGGWSFGGLVAWELAAQLRLRGDAVELLALVDTYPPGEASAATRDDLRQRAIALLHHEVDQAPGARLRMRDDDRDALDGEQRLVELEGELVRQGLVDARNLRAETARLLAAYEQNISAMDRYEIQPARQPVMLFAATEHGDPEYLRDAWSRYAHASVEFLPLAGSHYSIMKGANATRIADRLRHFTREIRLVGSVDCAGSPDQQPVSEPV